MNRARTRRRGPAPGALLARFAAARAGNATLEFTLTLPFVFYMVFAIAEVGTLMARNVTLERAVDLAVREIRLGNAAVASQDGLRDAICTNAYLIGRCAETLLIELRILGSGSTLTESVGTGPIQCVNRAEDIVPVVAFDTSQPNRIMLVRACLIVDPVFPGTGFLAELPSVVGGGYAVTVQAAFISEPA